MKGSAGAPVRMVWKAFSTFVESSADVSMNDRFRSCQPETHLDLERILDEASDGVDTPILPRDAHPRHAP